MNTFWECRNVLERLAPGPLINVCKIVRVCTPQRSASDGCLWTVSGPNMYLEARSWAAGICCWIVLIAEQIVRSPRADLPKYVELRALATTLLAEGCVELTVKDIPCET